METYETKRPDDRTTLVERFVGNPQDLLALHELKRTLSQEWNEDGFDVPSLYLDINGSTIAIAEKRTDEEADGGRGASQLDSAKRYRLLYDDAAHDVVVPREFQGFSIYTRGSGGVEFIYDLHPKDDPMSFTMEDEDGEKPLLPEIPEDLAELVKKFGDKLNVDDAGMSGSYAKTLDLDKVTAYELDGITEDARYRRGQAEDEARGIEESAQAASTKVRKKLFISAEKLAALKDEAYRAEIERLNNTPKIRHGATH